MKLTQLIRLLAVAASLAVFGSEAAAAAEAPSLELDPCLSHPADETRYLGADKTQVEARQGPGSLEDRSCPMYIVDVQVPVNSSGGPGYTTSFSLTATNAFSETFERAWHYRYCTEWREITRVYRKNATETAFTYLGEAAYRGVHDPARESCRLYPLESHDPWPSVLNPPASGVTVYRVLTSGWFEKSSWQDYYRRLVRAKHFHTFL